MTMEAVILASGLGARLKKITSGVPKCFFEVLGYPLMAYPILSLKKAGVKKIVVIAPVGFKRQAEIIINKLNIHGTVAENNEIKKGNAYSLLLSEKYVNGEKFIVSCCDTLYPPSAALALCNFPSEVDILVGVSKIGTYIEKDEASKVKIKRGRILKIGKGLKKYDFFDTGLFLMKKSIYQIKRWLSWEKETHLYELIDCAIKNGLDVFACDFGDIPWTEIDTDEDLKDLFDGKRGMIIKEILNG